MNMRTSFSTSLGLRQKVELSRHAQISACVAVTISKIVKVSLFSQNFSLPPKKVSQTLQKPGVLLDDSEPMFCFFGFQIEL